MPWCGYWGGPMGGVWWLMPLFGLAFMGFMVFFCFRGMGRWMSRPRRPDAELTELQREVASLRDEIRRLRQVG